MEDTRSPDSTPYTMQRCETSLAADQVAVGPSSVGTPVVSDDTHTADLVGTCRPSRHLEAHIAYFGDYELERVLGEGGMGTVYKARQVSLNRPVAVKMIRAGQFASPEQVHRFRNEAEAVARLEHPNIVPIFEVGRHEDCHYFSMRLILGESLDKRLEDYMAHPHRAARLVAMTADAIHHAHMRGILHRDLKPGNVLVDLDGQPHVTDFGLAKRIEEDSQLTRSGAILGTPAYMAPEQAAGARGMETISTDIYGLGTILYALLTGRAPFKGTTVLETLEQVRECPAESPRQYNPSVPLDLEVICLKCLEKDARLRYVSAEALAQDLRRWLGGEPIAARPTTILLRVLKWLNRNRQLATLSSLVAGVALLGLVGITWQWAIARERQAQLTQASRLAFQRELDLARARRLVKELTDEVAKKQAALGIAESRHKHAVEQMKRLDSEYLQVVRAQQKMPEMKVKGNQGRGGVGATNRWMLAIKERRIDHQKELATAIVEVNKTRSEVDRVRDRLKQTEDMVQELESAVASAPR